MRRGMGSLPVFIFSLGHSAEKNRIQMWLELGICIHSTMETVWMLSSRDLCISVTAALPQYAEVAHTDRSYPGFHILNGSWDAREFSHSGWALPWALPGFRDKLHCPCVATDYPKKSKRYLCHCLNISDIHGSNLYGSIRTVWSAF